jgi:subtilisin-like proprotein convertase family protein
VQASTQSVTPTTGDGDPYFEPGESASVAVRAENVGDGTATGVSVRLTSDDPQVTVMPHAHNYGTINAGHGHSRSFTVSLAADYPLGKPVQLSAQVAFAGALSPQSSVITVATGQPATTATDFAYTGPPVPIPDDDPTGASAPIDVTGMGYASKLTFSIDGTTCTTNAGAKHVGIDHTFVSDLTATLTSPSGQTAQLFSGAGDDGNNLCQVVFDDSAANPFATVTADQAPFTGTWRPNEPLSSLTTDPVNGTWTFTAVDGAALDTGTLRAVSLHVTGFVSS